MAGVFAALLGVLATPNAASGASSTAARPHLAQYHGLRWGQYHGDAAQFRGGSIVNRATRGMAAELKASIYRSAISSVLHFGPRFTSGSTRLAINPPIHRQVSTSIEPRSGDPRRMLQIGAVLGTIYVVFLATWIWATRLRARPPGRARA